MTTDLHPLPSSQIQEPFQAGQTTSVGPLAAIVHHSEDAIISKKLDGTVQSWNAGAEKIFGYSATDMIGQPIFKIVPESKSQEEWQLLGQLSEGQLIDHFETQRTMLDGRVIDVSLTLSPVKDLIGNVIGASTIARDITERKRSERALLRTQQKLSMAVSLTGLGIWEYRISDQAVTVTPEIRRIYQIPEDFAVDYAFFISCVVGDDRIKVLDLMTSVAAQQSEESFLEEIQVRCHGDDRIKWVRIQGKYMSAQGEHPESILGTIIDVTSEKTENDRLEKSVAERTALLNEANQKLAASNSELERFAFTASHDLREPLRKIISLGDMLEGGIGQNHGRAIEIVKKMRSASSRMMSMIDDLLQFARVSQKASEAFARIDVKSILREVTDDLETLISTSGAEIEIAGEFETVRGSHTLLKQVFQNLVQNAVKFSQPGVTPKVAIRGELANPYKNETGGTNKRGEQRNKASQIVTVSDNGVGFDAAHTDRVFELFQRLNGRSAYEGSGIGLAICKKIVEAHNGFISAESQVGQGAVFTVGIPLA